MELQLVKNWEAFRPYFAHAVDFIKSNGCSPFLCFADETMDQWSRIKHRMVRGFDLYGKECRIVGEPASKIITILVDCKSFEVASYDPTGTFFETICSLHPSILVLFGINWREIKEGEGIYHQELEDASLGRFDLLLKWPIMDRYLHGVFIRSHKVWGRNAIFSAPISILSLLWAHEHAMEPETGPTEPYMPWLWLVRSLTDHNDSLYAVYDNHPIPLHFPELVSFCDFVAGSLARHYINYLSFVLKRALCDDDIPFKKKLSLIGSNLDLDHPVSLTGYFIKPVMVKDDVLINTDMRSVEEIAQAGAKIDVELHFAVASETGHDAVHFPCGTSRLRVPERVSAGFVYQGG